MNDWLHTFSVLHLLKVILMPTVCGSVFINMSLVTVASRVVCRCSEGYHKLCSLHLAVHLQIVNE